MLKGYDRLSAVHQQFNADALAGTKLLHQHRRNEAAGGVEVLLKRLPIANRT